MKPASIEEAQRALPELGAAGKRVLFVGGRTQLRPGPAMDVELSTLGLDRMVDYTPADQVVSAEAGMTLAALQARLLASVERYVKPGGLLVYAVCTLMAEECDEQVDRFVKSFSQFRLEPPPPGFAPQCLDGRGFLRALPHRTGTDGFFAARLRRIA